jgi:peptidoglycan/LPS O-acetylase OafA/YrhL
MAAHRLEAIQVMRGIAASMVMIRHFAPNQEVFPHADLLGTVLYYGNLGVPIFFTISGFVIPVAMETMNYRLSTDAWPFFLRRIIRLEPTYIATVLLAFVLAYVGARTPGYRGEPFSPSLGEFVVQFLYIGPWVGVDWFNGVAWTLAIEFQYYLLMLLCAPLLLSKSRLGMTVFFAATVSLPLLVTDNRAIFIYLPCFAVGLALFALRTRRIGGLVFAALFVLSIAVGAHSVGVPSALASAVAAGAITLPIRRPVPVLSALGAISYSLYLVHALVGGRFISLAGRFDSAWMHAVGFVVAIAASVVSATALWYFVERPSHIKAKTISIKQPTL